MQYICFLKGVVIPDVHSTQKPATRKKPIHLMSRATCSENHLNKLSSTATNLISEVANTNVHSTQNTNVHSTQKHVTRKETFHLTSHVTESEKRTDEITTTAEHGISNIANKGTSNVSIKKENRFLVRFMRAM